VAVEASCGYFVKVARRQAEGCEWGDTAEIFAFYGRIAANYASRVDTGYLENAFDEFRWKMVKEAYGRKLT
jgi:hypothetical protein